MGNEKEDGRWFLIEHKECDSNFSINSKTFLNSFAGNTRKRNYIINCPNCGEAVLADKASVNQLIDFFKSYDDIIDILNMKKASIFEISLEDLEDSK